MTELASYKVQLGFLQGILLSEVENYSVPAFWFFQGANASKAFGQLTTRGLILNYRMITLH